MPPSCYSILIVLLTVLPRLAPEAFALDSEVGQAKAARARSVQATQDYYKSVEREVDSLKRFLARSRSEIRELPASMSLMERLWTSLTNHYPPSTTNRHLVTISQAKDEYFQTDEMIVGIEFVPLQTERLFNPFFSRGLPGPASLVVLRDGVYVGDLSRYSFGSMFGLTEGAWITLEAGSTNRWTRGGGLHQFTRLSSSATGDLGYLIPGEYSIQLIYDQNILAQNERSLAPPTELRPLFWSNILRFKVRPEPFHCAAP